MGYISEKAKIGSDCDIAATAIIHDNVIVGGGTTIGHYTILGEGSARIKEPLIIGPNSHIRSHSIFYAGSEFGEGLSTGHHCLVREGISAGVNLQIGSFNSLEGTATIGDYVRFHSSVNIGRGSKIGDLVWIFPGVSLLNDPIPPSGLMRGVTIEDGAVVCTDSVLLPDCTVSLGAFIAAKSKVSGTTPIGAFVSGDPAKVLGDIRIIRDFPTKKRHPWMTHFSDYYPEAAQDRISRIYEKLCEQFDANDKARKKMLKT